MKKEGGYGERFDIMFAAYTASIMIPRQEDCVTTCTGAEANKF